MKIGYIINCTVVILISIYFSGMRISNIIPICCVTFVVKSLRDTEDGVWTNITWFISHLREGSWILRKTKKDRKCQDKFCISFVSFFYSLFDKFMLIYLFSFLILEHNLQKFSCDSCKNSYRSLILLNTHKQVSHGIEI